MRLAGRFATELHTAWRTLSRNPSLTLIMVATLALGLGANTAIFSLVKSVLFVEADFGPSSGRIVSLHSVHPTRAQQLDDATLSWPEFQAVRESVAAFESVEGYAFRNFTLSLDEGAVRARGASITPGLFSALGALPAMGRLLTKDDAREIGFETTVLLSDALWTRQYGADPSIVGKEVVINGRKREVIGVMPKGFAFPERQELWMAYRPAADARPADRFLMPIATLRSGESLASIATPLATLSADLEKRWPETQKGFALRAARFPLSVVGDTPRVMTVLLAAVLMVLLIACANLAGLLVARSIERRREHALKTALGASAGSLARELLAEVLLVSIAGALLGWTLAVLAVPRLVATFPETPPYWMKFDVDVMAFVYCLALTLVTTLGAGLVPALRTRAQTPSNDLRDGGRAVTRSVGTRLAQEGLVVAQVGVCLALVVAAQLMIASFEKLQSASSGVREEGLLTTRLYLSGDAVDATEAKSAALARLIDGVASEPGVAHAALTTAIPADDGGATAMLVNDVAATPADEIPATTVGASEDLFDVLGNGLVAGRSFEREEFLKPDSPSVLLSASAAQRFGGPAEVVGKSIAIRSGASHDWRVVIGVVGDVQYEEFGEETAAGRRAIYVPYGRLGFRSVELVARTIGPADGVAARLREIARRAYPGFAVFETRTMAQVRESTTWDQRFFSRMMGVFASAALCLAALGLYGLLRQFVGARTHEIGVRRTLGASTAAIGTLVVSRAAFVAGSGVFFGGLLAIVASRGLRSLLYGSEGMDAVTFAVASAAVLGLVLLCSWIPVRRAVRVDPIVALREE